MKEWKTEGEEALGEVILKIGLERIDTQEGITVEVLLDNRVIGLAISLDRSRNLN